MLPRETRGNLGHGLLTGYQGPHHWFTICSQIAGSGRSGTGARLRGRMAVAGDHLRWLVQGSSLSRSRSFSTLYNCQVMPFFYWSYDIMTVFRYVFYIYLGVLGSLSPHNLLKGDQLHFSVQHLLSVFILVTFEVVKYLHKQNMCA